jgi:hypothetical protein
VTGGRYKLRNEKPHDLCMSINTVTVPKQSRVIRRGGGGHEVRTRAMRCAYRLLDGKA